MKPDNELPYDPKLIELMRKVYPHIAAQDIVSVQPMATQIQGALKMRRVRWYHKLMDGRYWRMGYQMLTKCHRGQHIMRHSCWSNHDFCEVCRTNDPQMKIGIAKIFRNIFGGQTWRF